MECPKCKTEPQHGSCVCDEVLVKDLKAERDELKCLLTEGVATMKKVLSNSNWDIRNPRYGKAKEWIRKAKEAE